MCQEQLNKSTRIKTSSSTDLIRLQYEKMPKRIVYSDDEHFHNFTQRMVALYRRLEELESELIITKQVDTLLTNDVNDMQQDQ